MKILLSGASGLVGSALVGSLRNGGHDVRRLARGGGGEEEISWNPQSGQIDQRALKDWDGLDAVVHLAGENIASSRWTEEKKRRIRDSRVAATKRLATSLAADARPPVLVGASAVGYYGDRGDEVLTERSSKGAGFLADTCEMWEAAAEPLAAAGTRLVHLRFGMILSAQGGALQRMLPIFRSALGGRLGSGRQWVSWITLHDVVRAIEFVLNDDGARGPFNAVSPNPVRNLEFTKALGHALSRPAIIPAPAFALRLVFGELADALLLSSQRVLPEKLEEHGFSFEHPSLRETLKVCLE